MRHHTLVLGLILAGGCSGGSGSRPYKWDAGDAGIPTLTVELTSDPSPMYPCAGATCLPQVVVNYHVTLTNSGASLQDLRITIPIPKSFVVSEWTFDDGHYNPVTGSLLRDIDWLPAGGAPITATATLKMQANLYVDGATDLNFATQAVVTQYDNVVASSAAVTLTVYLPAKVSTTPLTVYSSAADGTSVYVSALPTAGPFMNQGGIYRVAVADGSIVQIAKHALTPADTLPFLLDGSILYYVTHTADPANTVLMQIASDGSGSPVALPLPAGTLNVRAVGSDASHLFLILEAMDHTQLVYRLTKSDLGGTTLSSSALGTLEKNTIAVTSEQVVVLRTDQASIWKLDKATLTPIKLTDVGYVADERTLACDDTRCFWADGTANQLKQISLAGGVPITLAATTQRILFDGHYVYSGPAGLFRVGPDGTPPLQPLFAGYPALVQASDDTNVYFLTNYNGYFLWKIRK